MNPETVRALVGRVGIVKSDVDELRRALNGEEMATSDRQYLARCLDLLEMELGALTEYVTGMEWQT